MINEKKLTIPLEMTRDDFQKHKKFSGDTRNALISLCFGKFLRTIAKEGLIGKDEEGDLKFMLSDYVETFGSSNNLNNISYI